MADIIQNGATVRLIQPVIQGEVKDAQIIAGEIQYCVTYTDQNGDTQERFFPASSLEVVG